MRLARLPLAAALAAASTLAGPFAMTVEVVDELGAPVAGAAVWVDALPRLPADPWNAPGARRRIGATADGSGIARLEGEHALSVICPSSSAPGFHAGARRVLVGEARVRMVLPRRLGQVPARRFDLVTSALPDDDAEHGLDLELGAFLPPLGVGRRADAWVRARPASVGGAPTMRFASPGAGVIPTPRPGQDGFACSVSPACDGMMLVGITSPRLAPTDGYEASLRGHETPAVAVGSPQWIYRIRREEGWVHGLIEDFGRLPDGRIRLLCRVSAVAGSRALEFAE